MADEKELTTQQLFDGEPANEETAPTQSTDTIESDAPEKTPEKEKEGGESQSEGAPEKVEDKPDTDSSVEKTDKEKEPEKAQHMVPVSVVKDLRVDRRELMSQNAALKERLAAFEANSKKEEGDSDIFNTRQQISKDASNPQLDEFNERLLTISVDSIIESKKDGLEMISRFDDACFDKDGNLTNPQLWNQMKSAPNPGKYAYKWAKNQMDSERYGESIEEIREKLRQEFIETETPRLTKELTEKLKVQAEHPKSLSGARAAGGDESPEFKPPSATELYG